MVIYSNNTTNTYRDCWNLESQDEIRSLETDVRFWLEGVLLPIIGVVGVVGELEIICQHFSTLISKDPFAHNIGLIAHKLSIRDLQIVCKFKFVYYSHTKNKQGIVGTAKTNGPTYILQKI